MSDEATVGIWVPIKMSGWAQRQGMARTQVLGEPEVEGNSISLRREGGNLERQALIWALKDLCNLDRMKCAEKGFPVGGNSISKGAEASKCRGHLGQAKQSGRNLCQRFVGYEVT